MAKMVKYSWPGNIRELQNTVERCLILRRGPVIEEKNLNLSRGPSADQFQIPEIPPEGISLEEVEKTLVRKALEASGGNRSEAARLLKIPRHVLIYRLEKFDM